MRTIRGARSKPRGARNSNVADVPNVLHPGHIEHACSGAKEAIRRVFDDPQRDARGIGGERDFKRRVAVAGIWMSVGRAVPCCPVGADANDEASIIRPIGFEQRCNARGLEFHP